MTKLQLAQKRNYFKFVLSGMYRQIDLNALTAYEIVLWKEILDNREELLKIFDDLSRDKGLNVPEHKCWCGKEAKYTKDYVAKGEKATWVCKKHIKN
jgi:hypothetical protein